MQSTGAAAAFDKVQVQLIHGPCDHDKIVTNWTNLS